MISQNITRGKWYLTRPKAELDIIFTRVIFCDITRRRMQYLGYRTPYICIPYTHNSPLCMEQLHYTTHNFYIITHSFLITLNRGGLYGVKKYRHAGNSERTGSIEAKDHNCIQNNLFCEKKCNFWPPQAFKVPHPLVAMHFAICAMASKPSHT